MKRVFTAMYDEQWLFVLLPVMQKVSLVGCVGWLLAVHYALLNRVTQASTVPAKAIEPA